MKTPCPRCGGTRFLIDTETGKAELVGCLECDWDRALEYEWGEGPRCVAYVRSGYTVGSRCERRAIRGSGYCWQHADKSCLWDVVYERFRNSGRDEMPEAYRQVFRRALKDADIIVRDEDHERELAERARVVRAKPERGPSVIYFIERENLIKIGFTTNLTRRLKAIARGSSMPDGMTIGPVQLLAVEPGDISLETRLHRRFDRSRVGNTEWFRPSKALRRYIEDLLRHQRRADVA